MSVEKLTAALRDVPDFPKQGIIFKDITPILADPALFRAAVDLMTERHRDKGVDKVAAIEARGFIFGSGVARELGAGFIPIRKQGKLPYKTIDASYDLEYGSATLAMHVDAVQHGERILLIDDLLATGGTAEACVRMIEQLGGLVHAVDFLIELDFLKGREKLKGYDVRSYIHC
jgi:adenine phosphoribosyltransferase